MTITTNAADVSGTELWSHLPGREPRLVGIAIMTPSGLMLWVHDIDADQPDSGYEFTPLLHGVVDNLDSARKHVAPKCNACGGPLNTLDLCVTNPVLHAGR